LFDAACQNDKVDPKVVNCFIDVVGKTNHYETAKKTFYLAHEKKIVDKDTFWVFMEKAFSHSFEEVEAVYKLALKETIIFSRTYFIYVLALIKYKGFNAAKNDFYELVKKKYIPIVEYQEIINLMIKSNETIENIKEVYDSALKEEKEDRYFWKSFLTHAINQNKSKIAEEVFLKGLQDRLLDITIINKYVCFVCDKGDLEKNRKSLLLALESEIADVSTYNKFLDSKNICDHFDLAEKVFDNAVKKDLANSHTYCLFLKITAKLNFFELSEWVFDLAVKNKQSNEGLEKVFLSTFNQFIMDRGDIGDFNDVKWALEMLIKKQLVNSNTFNGFLRAAHINKKHEYAENAFKMSLELGTSNVVTYNIYLDIVLLIEKNLAKAQKIFETRDLTWDINLESDPYLSIEGKKTFKLDLHGLSYSHGFLVLLHYLNNWSGGDLLHIVTGVGEGTTYLKFRNTLMELFDEYQDISPLNLWFCEIHLTNEGRLLLKKK
jgi:hypothetical protein